MEAAFTETSKTWAYPDAHLVTEAYTGPVQIKQPGGSWAAIDTTLIEADGVLKPKMAKADVTFSTGGSEQPFVSMSRAKGQNLKLSWPTTLPRPVVAGNQATYLDAAGPGADLVVTARTAGFQHDVVLHQQPDKPLDIRIPITTSGGLKLGTTKAGGLKLTDAQGKTVAGAGEPYMTESSLPAPAGARDDRGMIETKIVTGADGGQVLVLKPDPEYLADPGTSYPVTIDPTVGLTVTQDMTYNDDYQASYANAIDYTGTNAKKVPVRVCEGSTCYFRDEYKAVHYRSLIEFGGFSFPGKAIVSAQMQLYGKYLGRCDNWSISVSPATSPWVASTTGWGNKPASTSTGSSSMTPSCSTSKSWHTWDLSAAANAWASGMPNNGVELKTTELNWQYAIDDPRFPDTQIWSFDSADAGTGTPPKLSVSYLLPPEIPTFTAESIDSITGNDAISRSGTVKTGYTSRSPDGRKLDYTITVTDATTQVDAPAGPAAGPPSSLRATAAPTGLVAGYGLDEGTGTTVGDASGSNNNGTTRDTSWVDGKFGKALSFNGGTSWVTINHSDSLKLTGAATLSAWVKPTTLSGYRTIVMKDHTEGSTYGLYASNGTSSSAWFHPPGSGHATISGGSALLTGAWSHVAVTYNGSAGTLYVNGQSVATGPVGSPLADTGGALHLGGNTKWGEFFAGVIDEVRVYNRAQTAAEIQADMNAKVAVPVPGDPPTAPGNLTATAGEGSIALKWDVATDDYGIGGYEVHRSKSADFTPSATTRLATTDKLTYTNGDLPGTGTYHYRVIALDNTGQPGPASGQASAYLKTLTFRVTGIDSGIPVNKTYELGSPETFRIKVKACITSYPATCNESPFYRITTDAPSLPTDAETGMADPTRPILSGMVSRPSGGQVTAKYYLYDNAGTPVGTAPLGIRSVNGGERASLQVPADTVQPGTTYKWQMVACAVGQGSATTPTPTPTPTATNTTSPATGGGVEEVCTSKTAPVAFTTPGTPPPPPVEDVRHLTLGKDNFVIKTAKTGPTACDGQPCTVTDDTVMRIGGTGVDNTVAVIGFKLDELPDGAGVSEGILKLGTPTCPTGSCPTDAVITATPLKSAVTSASKGSDLAGDADKSTTPYSLPLSGPQADIAGSEYQWLLLSSSTDQVVTFGEASAAEQPTVAFTYLPAGPPSVVLNLTGRGGDASATASWGLPENNGSISMLNGYDVEVGDAGGAIVKSMEVNQPFAAIDGLTNNVTYTIRVRAKTAFGTSDWQSTTATTKAVPPPPASGDGGGGTACVPYDEQSPSARAQSESGAQAYIDRVKHYYEAQDAVLEGRASTVWDAPGVDPQGPNTASLSLLNAALQQQREVSVLEGMPRTNSTVALADVVVQEMNGGSVRVLAQVKREWDVPTGAARTSTASDEPGAVEPMEFMISIHVFERCGKMSVIQVPYDAEEDSTDFDSGNAGGASLDPPIKNGEYSWWRGDLGRERDSKTGKLRMGKSWYVLARSYSEWEVPSTHNEWLKKWRLENVFSRIDVYPTKFAQYTAAYGQALIKHIKLSVESTVCFKTRTTTTQTNIGFTVGTDNLGNFGQSFTTKTDWECIEYRRALGKGVKPSLNAGVSWIHAECLDACSADFYRHATVGWLTVQFRGKDKLVHEELVRTDLSCEVERVPPQTFGSAKGSFKYPVCNAGGSPNRPILED
ncbi:LamG-like jellyroll fold domain-containing protein [Nonomuraea antri]|uniref:LamG-like jellyroll fold domain-containing protein n=1 Tax=Nonomuraea antri TaxID=2730852 RepID=UPI001C2C6424|nr:LamG-like jellyroll fold domain-containing protein [Nonomuraea antri]